MLDSAPDVPRVRANRQVPDAVAGEGPQERVAAGSRRIVSSQRLRRERRERESVLVGRQECEGCGDDQTDKDPGHEGSVDPDSRRISVRVHSGGEEPGGRYTLDLSSLSQMIFGGQFCMTNSTLPPNSSRTAAAPCRSSSGAETRCSSPLLTQHVMPVRMAQACFGRVRFSVRYHRPTGRRASYIGESPRVFSRQWSGCKGADKGRNFLPDNAPNPSREVFEAFSQQFGGSASRHRTIRISVSAPASRGGSRFQASPSPSL